MGMLRKRWQDFKKANPDFEKNKELKLDFGPQLDKFEDARVKLESVTQQVVKSAAEVDKARQNMVMVVAGYGVLVSKLAKTTPGIQKDFDRDFDWVSKFKDCKALEDAVDDLTRELAKMPD